MQQRTFICSPTTIPACTIMIPSLVPPLGYPYITFLDKDVTLSVLNSLATTDYSWTVGPANFKH